MLTHRRALALAWPVILAQAAAALPGLVDTAVIGRTDDATALAAVAIAAVTFSFLYWAFGFLRMATTGLTAQAMGSDDRPEADATLQRGLLTATGLGLALWLTLPLWKATALWLFQAEVAVEDEAARYLLARIGGAPAALMGFVINGWLLGMGRTRALLGFQLFLNTTNAVLDAALVGLAGMGAAGIGAGTAVAEWLALGLGLWLVRSSLAPVPALLDRGRLAALFSANRDVMIRTLALLGSFAWFTNAGTRAGTEAVAGNQVLLQLIAVSAFVLDGFAFLAEKEVGEAVGAGDRARLGRAIRITSQLALASGALFSLAYLAAGPAILTAFVADEGARASAIAYLPWCAAVPLLGVPAWQLDGVFLGATRGRALRTAAILATAMYLVTDTALRPWGNAGVWTALLASYGYRALALAAWLPGLIREADPSPDAHQPLP